MSSRGEVIEIGDKLKSSVELIKKIETNLASKTVEINGMKEDDKVVLSAMPVIVSKLTKLSTEWQDEWMKNLVETGVDLGTITSYAGSVFKPQEIPAAQIILCVLSDMEMMLQEIISITSGVIITPEDYVQVINKLVSVIATYRFIDQSPTKEKLEKLQFPFQALNTLLEEVITSFPDFEVRMEAIMGSYQ